ncbi:hypothetical protein KI387_029982, partial [Taxus chinensis]
GGIIFAMVCEDVDKSSLTGGWTRLDVGMTANVVMDLDVEEGIGEGKVLGIGKPSFIGKGLGVGEGDEEGDAII